MEVYTGYDLITFEDLGDWRWAGLLGAVGLGKAKALQKIRGLGWGSGNSETLRKNLKDAGLQPPKFPNAAHHIVPHNDPRSLPAIEIMARHGIHADDAANGVFLRYMDDIGVGANHRNIHTNAYFAEVNRRIQGAGSREELTLILRDIADELRLNTFPY